MGLRPFGVGQLLLFTGLVSLCVELSRCVIELLAVGASAAAPSLQVVGRSARASSRSAPQHATERTVSRRWQPLPPRAFPRRQLTWPQRLAGGQRHVPTLSSATTKTAPGECRPALSLPKPHPQGARGMRALMRIDPMMTMRQTSLIRQPRKGEPRPTRRLPAPADDQSSVESGRDHDTGRLGKPRKSQPEGGKRFTSQTGRHHYETLGQLAVPQAHTSRRFSRWQLRHGEFKQGLWVCATFHRHPLGGTYWQ